MTLVEFLTARLSEDEQVAKAATLGPWRVVNVTDYGSATVDGPDALQDGGYDDTTKTRRQVMRPQKVIPEDVDYGPTVGLGDAAHIARHDPARVLREVEAKRQLLKLHQEGVSNDLPLGQEPTTNEILCMACTPVGEPPFYPCSTLRTLATPYDEHPDYQEAWRV